MNSSADSSAELVPKPAGDLGLFKDLDEPHAIVLLQRAQGNALPAERRHHGAVEVPDAPVVPVPPAASTGKPATEAT
jgi:hypothetical protein